MAEKYSQILAEFVSETDAADLPEAVLERSRQSILNGVASALTASTAESIEILVRVLSKSGSGGDARLIGRQERLDLLNAVLINGCMSHLRNYGDEYDALTFHTSCTTVPALLGLGADRHATGCDAVTSLAFGLEAAIRLAEGLGRVHYELGWHTTGTLGSVATAMTCSRLLGLDATSTNHALGLALTQSAGLRGKMFDTMAKGFNAGKGAYNGLLAALLAEQSFSAAPDAIESADGYAKVASRTEVPVNTRGVRGDLVPEDAADLERITDGLGSRWEMELISFKPYASANWTHAAIDAVFELRGQLGLDGECGNEEILNALRGLKAVSVTMPEEGFRRSVAGRAHGKAQFNSSIAVALGLVRGRVGPAQFDDSVIADPIVTEIRDKIEFVMDANLGRGAGSVTADLANGRQITIDVAHARGTPQHPLDDADLHRKLVESADGVLSRKACEELADALENVEGLDDVSTVLQLASR